MELFTIVSLALILIFALLLLRCEGLLYSNKAAIAAIILTAAALAVRGWLFPHESDDYLNFLHPWTEFFRDNGGFKALAFFPGNYNPPYMYFLAAFSYFGVNELYLIKALSVIFDVLLAWSCVKLLSIYTESKPRLLAVFFVILFLPTVVSNSAYWGQCDSIYTFFGIYALYLGLRGKGVGSMVSLAACLAFKLQAVFIIPMFFVLLLAKKIKWRHLLVFPAAYVAFLLPAVVMGAPFGDMLTLYFSQAGSVGDAMNYNAPSLTAMFTWGENTAESAKMLIIAAFILIAAVYAAAIFYIKNLDDRVILGFALIMTIGIPYLLPHMHDRYFYIAGMLSVVLAMTDLWFSFAAVFAEMASINVYHAYLVDPSSKVFYYFHPRVGSELMLAALLLSIAYAVVYIRKSRKIEINS